MFKQDATGFVVFLFLLALLLGQGTLALLLGLALLALGVARLWSRLVLRRVGFERTLSPDHAFVGDQVDMHVRVRNPKLLGVPSLRVHDLVSARLEFHQAKLVPSTQPGTRLLERFTSLRPFEVRGWHTTLRCTERGCYYFGPVSLEATDPWGLFTNEADIADRSALIVYPSLLPLAELGLPPRHPLGEVRAARQLLSDPARTIGIRDYQREDPFKAIHWGATARRGALQSRIYEPTTSLEVAIALDVDTFEQYWEGVQPELAERMISVAATVASAANEERWSFGLYANCATVGGDQFVRIPPSRSPAQLPLALETLAKVVPFSLTPMPQLLRRLGPRLPWGSTLLVVSAVPSEAMQQTLLRLADRGRHIIWLYCGSQRPPSVPGVDIRLVAPDARWRNPEQNAAAPARLTPATPHARTAPWDSHAAIPAQENRGWGR
jgi:uncharacterized protein (DUF58 family)